MKKSLKIIVLFIILAIILVPNITKAKEDRYVIELYKYSRVSDIDKDILMIMNKFVDSNAIDYSCSFDENDYNVSYCIFLHKTNNKKILSFKYRNDSSVFNSDFFDDDIVLDDFGVNDNIIYSFSQEEKNDYVGTLLEGYNGIELRLADNNTVYLNSINEKEKTKGTIVKGEPQIKNLNIDLDLRFSNVNDYALYEVDIVNNTDTDYFIEKKEYFGDDEYIKYQFLFENDDNLLTAKSEKTIQLKVSYDKEVPQSILAAGNYSNVGAIKLDLKTEVADTDNPNTFDSLVRTIVVLFVSIVLLVLAIKVEKIRKAMFFFIVAMVIVPSLVNAFERISITINAKIEVVGCKYKLITNKGSFSNEEDIKEICLSDLIFGDDKEITTLNLIQTQGEYSGELFLGIDASKINISNDSYIKIYKDSSKQELILTLTKDNFYNNEFDLGSANFNIYNMFKNKESLDYFYLGYYNSDDIYVESSDDLVQSEYLQNNYCDTNSCIYDNGKINYSIIKKYKGVQSSNNILIGPYIDDESVIEKIYGLYNRLSNEYYGFGGFTNCHIYDEGNEDVCEGNNYYAIITPYSYG